MSGINFDLTINLPTILAGLSAVFAGGKLVGSVIETMRALNKRLEKIETHLGIAGE